MDDFRNTTKTKYFSRPTEGFGYAKGGAVGKSCGGVMKKGFGGTVRDRNMMESTSAPPRIVGGRRLPVDRLEGNDSVLVGQPKPKPPRVVTVRRTEVTTAPAEPKTDLMRKLTTLPSQRGEYKKGGLAVMPKGKKC